MDGVIRQLCTRDIGGNHQRLYTVNTQHLGVTFKHILLPVWLAPYRYQQQTYQILVNGRTGKVVGTRPYSWMKIALLVLVILAVLGIVFYFVNRTRNAPPNQQQQRAPAKVSLIAPSTAPWTAPSFPRCAWERTPGSFASRQQNLDSILSTANATQSAPAWVPTLSGGTKRCGNSPYEFRGHAA